jgi:hypothetical protein
MSVSIVETTIEYAQTICAGCNIGRVSDQTGRPTVDPNTILNSIRFSRPGALTGQTFYICDACLEELQQHINAWRNHDHC